MTEPGYAIIVAMDKNRLIGSDNRLPWHLPEDLAHFRKHTLGHTVIMGKNTFLSLGKPLDERVNVVLTRDPDFAPPGVVVCHSLQECADFCGAKSCFVIGGAQVFRLFLPLADRLIITRIEAAFEGDTWFPKFDLSHWKLVAYEALTASSGIAMSFNEYIKEETC